MGQTGGGFGALPGFGGMSFGSSSANRAGMTDAFKNSAGQLTEFNPLTMSGTTKAPEPSTAPQFTAAGMDATTGMPSYITNWLQSGGTGTMPTSTGILPASPAQQSQAGELIVPKSAPKVAATGKEAIKSVPKVVTPAATTKTAAAPAMQQVAGTGGGGGYGPVYGGPGSVGQPGSLVVNDQYNPTTGTSNPVATPGLGAGLNNTPIPPLFSDGKGHYFYDAAGKQAVPANALQQYKNQGMMQGIKL